MREGGVKLTARLESPRKFRLTRTCALHESESSQSRTSSVRHDHSSAIRPISPRCTAPSSSDCCRGASKWCVRPARMAEAETSRATHVAPAFPAHLVNRSIVALVPLLAASTDATTVAWAPPFFARERPSPPAASLHVAHVGFSCSETTETLAPLLPGMGIVVSP